MIPLTKYVCTLSDNIMSWHFKEEFDLDYNHGYMFLISEKHGTYDGLMEFVVAIAEQLATDIDGNEQVKYELTKEQLIDEEGKEFFENIFFDKIIIDASLNNNDTAYLSAKSHYVDNTKSLDIVYIKINTKEDNNYDKLVRALAHELTHAYENYRRLLSGKDSLESMVKKGTRYYNAIDISNDCSLENTIKEIEYRLTSFEKNAYLTELRVSLEGKKIRDYKQALSIFEKTDVWKQYMSIYSIINNKNVDWQDFCDTYNEEFDTNYTTSKFKKWMTNRISKVYNKMMKLIPKVYFDYYEEQRKKEINEDKSLPEVYKGKSRLAEYIRKRNVHSF